MRIRSTKPEFWRSKTIAQFDWDTRLILKALEAYVDDNGVGKDSVVMFAADAFPYDLAKSSEVCAKITRSLSRLSEAGLIVRYSVAGESLVYIRHWKRWQYIDKPKTGRWPRPDGTREYKDTVDETIGAGQGVTDPAGLEVDSETTPKLREDFAKTTRKPPEVCPQIQSGEQGNRGTEQNPPYPPAAEPAPPHLPAKKTGAETARARFDSIHTCPSVAAREVAHAYNRSLAVPLQAKVLGEVADEIDQCLRDHIPPEAIAAGIELWTRSDSWSPSQIPKFVHKANNRGTNRNGSHVGKPTESALDYQAAAEQLLAKVTTK